MKRRKGAITLILIRRLLVGLAILEFALPMFLAPAPAGASSARLRFRLLIPGSPAPQSDESSPAESTDQDLETDEVPKNTHERSRSSLKHVRFSRRRPGCHLGFEGSNIPRTDEAARTVGARSWTAASPSELAVGLPVRLGRLTC